MGDHKGYSCKRDDWRWMAVERPDGSKFITGVVFRDGHEIRFADCPQHMVDAYLKAGALKRDKRGQISVTSNEEATRVIQVDESRKN